MGAEEELNPVTRTETVMDALNSEGGKSTKKSKCSPTEMIDPDHQWRLRWDALLMLFIVYNAILVPMTVAFGTKGFSALSYVDNVADSAFIIDLFLSFRTGFYVRDGAD